MSNPTSRTRFYFRDTRKELESDEFDALRHTLEHNHVDTDRKSLRLLARAIVFSRKVKRERKIGEPQPGEEHFADPLDVAKALSVHANADSSAIIASIIYSSLRRHHGQNPDEKYFLQIRSSFGEEVEGIVRKALEISNVDVPAFDPAMAPKQLEKHFEDVLRTLRQTVGNDERALLIRLMEWKLYLKNLDSTDEKRLPSKTDIVKTRYLYLPMAEMYFLPRTKHEIGEEWLRLADRKAYSEIKGEIRQAESYFGNAAIVEKDIMAALKAAGLDKQCEIEFRIKSPDSIYRNREIGKNDINDIIGFRVIVDPQTDDPAQEEALVYKAHKAVASVFTPVPGYFRDCIQGEQTVNGYQALHDTLAIGGDGERKFSAHFVSRKMYAHNEGDPRAIHAGYKYGDVAREVGYRMVSIFPKNGVTKKLFTNNRYRMTFGRTAADFLGMMKGDSPDEIFAIEDISITRINRFRHLNPEIDNFRQLLVSGDTVEIKRNNTLKNNPRHRLRVIEACTEPSLKERLIARHEELLSKSPRHFLSSKARQVAALPDQRAG